VRAARTGVPEADAIAAALDATAERLDALLTRERTFSADASHQLRTPLAALRIELEALELRGDAPEELDAALAQVERLQATIDTLLAVRRDVPRRAAPAPLGALADDAEGGQLVVTRAGPSPVLTLLLPSAEAPAPLAGRAPPRA
jgi:signal transduction histidine kinase